MQTEDDLKLSDSQLEAFLHKSGFPEKLVWYFEQLPSKIGYSVETILDCGGGNGEYLDLLLKQFPNAQGTLVDSAQFMLDQNKPHPRKQLILGNLDDLSNCVKIENRGGGGDRQFDLICFSDVLHHCISPTYQETRNLQTAILKNAKTLLSPNGNIIVSERIVNSWLPYDYSTRLIYNLTRSKSIASIIKLLGANTAGVGVAFMSRGRFEKLCNDVGLTIIEETLISENKKYSIKSILTTSVRYFGLGISSLTHRLFRLTMK